MSAFSLPVSSVTIDNVVEERPSLKLMHNIKGIIFDFDGTLFDNAYFGFFLIAANPLHAIRVWKERLVRKRFAGRDFATPERYYNAFFTAMGKMCFARPSRIQNWYFNRYMPRMVRVLRKHYQFRPGVQELFRRFDAATSTAPSSNFPRAAVYSDYPFLKERMEAMGLRPGPGVSLYSPESFGAQKPAPRPFRQIAANLGIAPEEVLVVGDREETDGLGAFHAGMRFFCLETGRRRYFRVDPYRRRMKEEPHGPIMVMHTGVWDDLITLLMGNYPRP